MVNLLPLVDDTDLPVAFDAGMSPVKAAICAGYSKRTAEKIGSENLRKPEIRAAVDAAKLKRAEKGHEADCQVYRAASQFAIYVT